MRFDNLGFLGIAKKAGALISGDTAVENALTRGNLKLLLVAEDASARTRKRFEFLASEASLMVMTLPQKELVGNALGIRPVAVVGVINDSFAKGFIKACEKNSVEAIEDNKLAERVPNACKERKHGGEVK